MRIKFQADADLREEIVKGIRRTAPEIDFLTSNDAGLEGVSDPEVLAIAAAEGRILVTNDRQTMPGHFAEFIQERHSSGVIVVSKKLPTKRVIEELILIWSAAEPSEYIDRIMSLP